MWEAKYKRAKDYKSLTKQKAFCWLQSLILLNITKYPTPGPASKTSLTQ